VSFLCAAPAVLNQLIDYYEAEGEPEMTGEKRVRVTTARGAPPEATIRAVEDRFGWYLKHLYGATETGPLITISDTKRLMNDENRFEIKKRQGMGVLGTDVRVVDEEGNDVPRDDATLGEIVVRGNQIMDRYWNKPDETDEAFNDRVEGYYHTGDLASVDENGLIAIRDRKKDIIIGRGEHLEHRTRGRAVRSRCGRGRGRDSGTERQVGRNAEGLRRPLERGSDRSAGVGRRTDRVHP